MSFKTIKTSINLESLPLFSLIPNALSFIKFESFPIMDEISSAELQVEGSQFPIIEPGSFGNGLRLRPSSFLTTSMILKNTTSLSIGFWLNPVYLKPALDPNNQEIRRYRMSLLDKSKFQFDSQTGHISSIESTFVIMEESRGDNFNVMQIILYDPDGNEIFLESEEYSTGELHHFWISYLGNFQNIVIFIDGMKSSLSIISGIIPLSLRNISSSPLHINFSAVGNNSLIRNNFGFLEELVIINDFISSSTVISKIINIGTETSLDEQEIFSDNVNIGFIFDDPSSVTIKSLFSNGTNVYIGRSDGKLMKGTRTMWQSNREFSNEKEEASIIKQISKEGGDAVFTNGLLEIKNASVRFS